MGIFDDYLTNLSAPPGQPGADTSNIDRKRAVIARQGGNPFSDFYNPAGGGSAGPSASSGFPGGAEWIRSGFAPAFGYIKGGSEAAAGLLRQAYEGQFRARAAGYAGGMEEAQRGFGSQIASQHLSPDVAARQLFEQRMGGLQGLAQARGEGQFGLNSDLAKLAKGTGTEFAGLTRDELEQMVNFITASKAAKATQNAGELSSIATLFGGVLGGVGSDPRLKKNVVQVGMMKHAGHTIPIYEYAYKDRSLPGRYVGVMAPDVEHIKGIVSVAPSGFQMVDYIALEKLTGFKFRKVAGSIKLPRIPKVAKAG